MADDSSIASGVTPETNANIDAALNSSNFVATKATEEEDKKCRGAEAGGYDYVDDDDRDETLSTVSIQSTSVSDMDVLEVARLELGETKQVREAQLQKLRRLIKTTWPQFQNLEAGSSSCLKLDDEEDEYTQRFLLRFLRTSKFNVAKSATMIANFLKMRNTDPDWHIGLGGDFDQNQKALELVANGYFFVAPGRDGMGRKVVVNIARRLDPTRHSAVDMMRCMMMTLETVIMVDDESQVRGLTYVFDCRGLTLQHCRLWPPTEATRMMKSLEKNIPLRHRAMFITNTPYGMGAVIEFVKSFISGKIKQRIHVVHDSKDLANCSDQLLKSPDVLPSELMPSEGDAKYSAKEMAEMWKEVVLENEQHLRNLDQLSLLAEPQSSPKKDLQTGCNGKKANGACWYNKFWSS